MNITPQQTEKLLKGNYIFSLWSFSMMITKLKNIYAKDPTPTTLHNSTKELNAFIEKFNKVMGADYSIISKL
ncbi:MAG: hypothetical protein LBI42_04860 [Chitinispirillales bacterium]|jgi:hypothetical protein|nr:hypothetical protein [Chitinispirillales bacterium]